MPSSHSLMPAAGVLPPALESLLHRSMSLFSRRLKLAWVLIILPISMTELAAIGPMPPAVFYFYYTTKVLAFFALGFLSPLAFHRLNGMGRGVFCSLTSAVLIEVSQGILHNGHSFHWHELAGKLALISIGFALALERRYERKISFGPLAIHLRTLDV